MNKKWEMVKLGELISSQPKSKVKAGEGLIEGKYKFYTSSNTQSKFLDTFSYNKPALIFGTGGLASIHFCDSEFSTSTDCIVFYSKNEEIFLKFVYLYLNGNMHILDNGFKGAGLKHISKDYILNIDIPLPPLDEQKKIAQELDKLQSIIQMRKEQIEKMDLLVKAKFVEMVSVKSKEYKEWTEKTIEELAKKQKGSMRTGPFGSSLLHSEFTDDGIFVLGIDNAVQNKFSYSKMRYISKEKYNTLKNYTVYPDDVIITIMGTVGRSAVVPKDIPLAINTKHLACITLNQDIANPCFVAHCITTHPYILEQIKRSSKGAIMDGLNLTLIKALKLPLPPIELQNQFADYVQKVEKIKSTMHAGLEKIELLYNSRMQEYFG